METKMMNVAFAAIDKEWEEVIPQLIEVESVKDYVLYGKDNQYPEYLYNLYNDVSTLKTIIEGTADYICGDDVTCNIQGFETEVNTKGDTMKELVRLLARDYLIYGGFAFQVIRNKVGDIRELHYIDFRYIRSSKKNEVFWYSEDFSKKYVRGNKTVIYPKYIKENRDIASSIVYVTNTKSSTYPIPRYSGSLKACEIERSIDTYHLSSLENGFGGSYIINFLNGIPTDEMKAEIEKNVNEKFCGAANAGRILINFANGADNAATLEKLDTEDFGAKYAAAAERAKTQIFTACRAIPSLFGDLTTTTGFNSQEFIESFKVFNRTVCRPIQQIICDNIDKVFNNKNSIVITPFSLVDTQNEEVK
jgi:phage portal protein BeeE